MSALESLKKKYLSVSLNYTLRLMWAYKDLVRTHWGPMYNGFIRRFRKDQLDAMHALKSKLDSDQPLEVAFLLTIPGMWKSDYLFKAMEANPHYHPYFVIYPYSAFKGFDKSHLDDTIEKTRVFLEQKGYEYVIPYDKKTGKWQDINKTLRPDVVFFTTPYKDIPPQYYIYNFRHTMTCYVPYSYICMKLYEMNYDMIFHNLVGMHFLETDTHLEIGRKTARNGGENMHVSGYPGIEILLTPEYQPKEVWKRQEHPKKRVIWAPHHTIGDTFNISTFLDYYDTMLELTHKYEDTIQFVFKPHQLLRFKLEQLWGKERTDAYYDSWNAYPNTQLEESNYVDYFLTSDAMVHDSGSFTTEYIYVQKPVMFLVKGESDIEKFNPIGQGCFANHYQGHSAEEIDEFLQKVVLDGDDTMKPQRDKFYNDYLAPKDGLMPSQKIIQLIENAIRG